MRENVRIAWLAIGSQRLRAVITVGIIALGIMALVAMITATQALENKVNKEFGRMGSNTFTMRAGSMGGRGGQVERENPPITYNQANRFTKEYDYPAVVSMTSVASFNATLRHASVKSNPNIRVLGCEPSYLELSGYDLESGRNFSQGEMEDGTNAVIIGADVKKQLFENTSAVAKELFIGNYRDRCTAE